MHKGFTLFEIIITLLIIGIITACSVPLFADFFKKEQANVLAHKLLNAIYLAQNTALQKRISTQLMKNPAGQGYAVFANEELLYRLPEYNFLHWQGALATHALEFNTEGRPVTDGSFWYCESKQSNPLWAVIINQLGRVRLVYPDENNEIRDSEGRKLIC